MQIASLVTSEKKNYFYENKLGKPIPSIPLIDNPIDT